MENKQEKTVRYIKGSAKEASFSKDGELINFSILVDDLQSLLDENPDKHKKGYVQLEMKRMKQPDNYGNTHSIRESSYSPKTPRDGGGKLTAKQYIERAESKPALSPYNVLGKEVVESSDQKPASDDLPF